MAVLVVRCEPLSALFRKSALAGSGAAYRRHRFPPDKSSPETWTKIVAPQSAGICAAQRRSENYKADFEISPKGMAERAGFEPAIRFTVCTLSKRVP